MRACSICTDPRALEINAALVAGDRVSVVARRFEISDDALGRHFAGKHWPAPAPQVAAESHVETVAAGNNLLLMAGRLRDDTIRLAAACEARGDLRGAVAGLASAARILQLCAELEGSLDYSPTTVNVEVNNFTTVQVAILAALADEPSAKAKVLLALERVEHEGESA